MTLPSDLNMLTSSMAWMGCTFIFLSVDCSFLSSAPALLCTFFTFLRGVPLPLDFTGDVSPASSSALRVFGSRKIRGKGVYRGMEVIAYPASLLAYHLNQLETKTIWPPE